MPPPERSQNQQLWEEVERTIGAIEGAARGIQSQVKRLEETALDNATKVGAIEGVQGTVQTRLDRHSQKFDQIENELARLRDVPDILKRLGDDLAALSKAVEQQPASLPVAAPAANTATQGGGFPFPVDRLPWWAWGGLLLVMLAVLEGAGLIHLNAVIEMIKAARGN